MIFTPGQRVILAVEHDAAWGIPAGAVGVVLERSPHASTHVVWVRFAEYPGPGVGLVEDEYLLSFGLLRAVPEGT